MDESSPLDPPLCTLDAPWRDWLESTGADDDLAQWGAKGRNALLVPLSAFPSFPLALLAAPSVRPTCSICPSVCPPLIPARYPAGATAIPFALKFFFRVQIGSTCGFAPSLCLPVVKK